MERCAGELSTSAERRERGLLKDSQEAGRVEDVIGGKYSLRAEVRKRGLELPCHVSERVQAVVVKHVNGPAPPQQRWKLALAIADYQRPAPLQIAGDE